jgi:ribosomal protein S18 acetylase RimI-like enzyme
VIVERASRNGRLTGHIVTLDVNPAERRRGLGTLLMQTAEEQMKEEGAGAMSLEVAESNSVAREFYRRLGFATVGRISKYYAGRVDAEVMEKVI